MRVIINHIIYALSKVYQQRQQLAHIVTTRAVNLQAQDIDVNQWKTDGISVVALDFDGVLSPHGDKRPIAVMQVWLNTCLSQFAAERVFILSNCPSSMRIEYFQTHFPGIRFIFGGRKKPFPDGLLKIINRLDVSPQAVMLVDDRLLTGGLAACLAGTQLSYVTSPYVNFSQRPIKESFFISLRYLERWLIQLIG